MSKDYTFEKYIYPSRWMSYWYQIKSVIDLGAVDILEVGVGSGFVTIFLKNNNIRVTTLDVDESLCPDVVGSVLDIPLKDNSFEAVICAEVLEHLPFDYFERGLTELGRVAKGHIILSLPHFGPSLRVSIKIPLFREKRLAIKIPFPFNNNLSDEHCWEIGRSGYSPRKIRKIISKYFKIKKEFIPFENQYHHFFVLEKNS